MPDKRKILYDNLKKDGLYTKSYEDFGVQFESDKARASLHKGLAGEGIYTKSIDDFNNQFFSDVKKKRNYNIGGWFRRFRRGFSMGCKAFSAGYRG